MAGTGLLLALTALCCLSAHAVAGEATDPQRWFTLAEIRRADAYHARLLWLSVAVLLSKLAVLGGLYACRRGVERMLPAWATKRWYLELAAWALVAGVCLALLNCAGAALLHRWQLGEGLTEQTAAQWLRDILLLRGRGVVMLVLTTVGVYALIGLFGRRWWWLAALVLLLGICAGGAMLTRQRTNNLRYDLVPLTPGPLRSHVESLLLKSGQSVTQILIANTSRYTTRANAWIALFGLDRRLVLTDTLVERYSLEEIGVIVAHELGHLRERTMAKRFGVTLLRLLLTLAVAQALLTQAARRAGAGFGAACTIPLYLMAAGLGSLMTRPIAVQVTKRSEASANLYALEFTRAPAAFVQVRKRLAVESLTPIHPPALVRALFMSRPSPVEAIAAAHAWARARGLPIESQPPAPGASPGDGATAEGK